MDTVLETLQALQGLPAYALVFAALLASGFFLPVNEDLLLVVAAALTLRDVMAPVPLVVVGWCGVIAADGLVLHWGRRFGPRLLGAPVFARVLDPQRMARMQAVVARWGPVCLFAGRFLPGLRTPLLLAAGSLGLRYRAWFLCDGLAAAIEVPLLVYVVRYLGGHWEAVIEAMQSWGGVAALLAIAAVIVGGLAVRRARRRK